MLKKSKIWLDSKLPAADKKILNVMTFKSWLDLPSGLQLIAHWVRFVSLHSDARSSKPITVWVLFLSIDIQKDEDGLNFLYFQL